MRTAKPTDAAQTTAAIRDRVTVDLRGCMAIDAMTQALPAIAGLLAAWDGAIRFIHNDH